MISLTFWHSRGWRLVLLGVLVASCGHTIAEAHEIPGHADDAAAPTQATIRELVSAFRRTGDDVHLDHAWSLLEPALDHGMNDADLLVEAAIVAQSRHEFDRALALVDEALAIASNNDQAWLLRASILLVRGEAAAAERACSQLRDVPILIAVTCRARVSIAKGEHEKPLRQLTVLLDSAAAAELNPDGLAWSWSVAGDAAAPIDPARATAYFTTSLQAVESTQVRAALVDVLLAEGRLEDAGRVIDAGADALPLSIRRMIVAKRSGKELAAKDIRAADHEFRHWIEDQDWLHAREMARFYLDVLERPALARRLAEINLAKQREPEDLLLASRIAYKE